MKPPASLAPPPPGLPPRVLLVSSTLDEDGGIPVCVAQLAEGLAGHGAAVEIAGQHASRPATVVTDVASRGLATLSAIAAPWHPLGQWRAARRMRRIVAASAALAAAEGRRFVVHLHGVWVAPVQAAARAATAAGATLVVSPHGMLRAEALRKSRWRKRLVWHASLRRLLLRADTLHVTSPAEGEDLVALLPGCGPVLVPLGVRPPADAPRDRAAGAPRRAGYLGRLLPIKHLDGLLEAWKAAAPAGWRLSIRGPSDGHEAARLATLADRLGIAAGVEIGGAVPQEGLGEHFASLDLFVLPSRSEAFALVVGEALAAGVPAICTTAAPWAAIAARDCGWSVAPTVPALAEALERATALAPEALRAMGRRGQEWVRAEYSWGHVAGRHLDELYRCARVAPAPVPPSPA